MTLTSVLEPPPVPRVKRPLNPWVLVCVALGMFVVLVVVGLSVLAFLAPKRSSQANEFRMSDGKVLRIEGMNWGHNHELDFDDSPSGTLGFWDRRRVSLSGRTLPDRLMVWMTCRDARTGRPLDFDWWSSSVVIDVHGDELHDLDPYFWQLGAPSDSSHGGNRPFVAGGGDFHNWGCVQFVPCVSHRSRTLQAESPESGWRSRRDLRVDSPVAASDPILESRGASDHAVDRKRVGHDEAIERGISNES